MGSLAPLSGDSEVLLSCDNSMWPLRLAWKEKNGFQSTERFVDHFRAWPQNAHTMLHASPDGTVREDQNEEVVCAQEEIF